MTRLSKMKVQFDSNTWRQVVDPDEFITDVDYMSYLKVHDAIVARKIKAYLSETMFTTEAIVRKKRQGYFARYSPKVTSEVSCVASTVSASFTMGPEL